MKTIRIMKHVIFLPFLALILLAIFFTTEAPGQDSVNSAIIAGHMRLSLTNSATELVRASAREGTIAVQVGGTNVLVPVKLNASRYEYKGSFGTRTNYSLSAVEFAITSTSSTQFTWLCWAWPWDCGWSAASGASSPPGRSMSSRWYPGCWEALYWWTGWRWPRNVPGGWGWCS